MLQASHLGLACGNSHAIAVHIDGLHCDDAQRALWTRASAAAAAARDPWADNNSTLKSIAHLGG